MIELFYGLTALGVFWAVFVEEDMHNMPIGADFWMYILFTLLLAVLWPVLVGVSLYQLVFSGDNEND